MYGHVYCKSYPPLAIGNLSWGPRKLCVSSVSLYLYYQLSLLFIYNLIINLIFPCKYMLLNFAINISLFMVDFLQVITPVTIVGNKGLSGQRGATGNVGATGIVGVRGSTGDRGSQGDRVSIN